MNSQSYTKTTLSNGVKILSMHIPHVRSVAMGVWLDTGSRDEYPEENGMAHFIEHMLFKGTTTRSAYEIAKAFDAIGGHTNAFTSMESTCFHAKAIDTHLEKMSDILSDIFLNPAFIPEEMENELQVVLQEISMTEDNSDEYVHLLFDSHFWEGHPFSRSILGTPEMLMSFTRDDVLKFFRRNYDPQKVIIAAAGNMEHSRVVDLVGKRFETIKSGLGFPDRTPPVIRPHVMVHEKDIEQAHICIGMNGINYTSPDRFAAGIMNTILGGNMSSRLFQEIREKRGLAYNVYSFNSTNTDSGSFGVYAGVAPENAQKSVALIKKELDRLIKETVSQSEFDAAREFIRGNILLAEENTDGQVMRIAQNEAYFGRFISVEEVSEKLDQVTREDIQRLASECFSPESLALTALGPDLDRNKLKEALYS
ncbi:M16 family metallopeptidase [Desulforegula conservatrix]|uniref:M16 family metallopeptidase n=1 Tax=Desulforegula conservatrix TaxID=153026 RepID=UPI00041A6785|nr:pitrilysin family protein [Desulforegula conservatrix]